MYIYVPDNVAANPPILLVAQSCGNRTAPDFFVDQNVVTTRNQADANGYIVILPEHTNRNCFDSGSTASLTRDGGGDTEAFIQMVRYTLETYDGDPERVYIAGGSGGGMMTQAMLAVYPDVFKAGASRAGAPAGCWGVGYRENDQWSDDCAGGRVSRSAQEWGDLVRELNPDYTGPYPRVQLFHASADETISYNNMGEAIKEWSNVFGLPEAPTSSGSAMTSMATYDREQWSDDCGYTVLDAWHFNGGNHSSPSYEWNTMLEFFGLHVPAGGLDPRDEMCPDAGTTDATTETEGDAETGDDSADTTGDEGNAQDSGNEETGTVDPDTSSSTEEDTSASADEESTTTGEEESSGEASEDEESGEDEEESGNDEDGNEDEDGSEDEGSSDPSATTDAAGCACAVERSSVPPLGTLAFGFVLSALRRRRRIA